MASDIADMVMGRHLRTHGVSPTTGLTFNSNVLTGRLQVLRSLPASALHSAPAWQHSTQGPCAVVTACSAAASAAWLQRCRADVRRILGLCSCCAQHTAMACQLSTALALSAGWPCPSAMEPGLGLYTWLPQQHVKSSGSLAAGGGLISI